MGVAESRAAAVELVYAIGRTPSLLGPKVWCGRNCGGVEAAQK